MKKINICLLLVTLFGLTFANSYKVENVKADELIQEDSNAELITDSEAEMLSLNINTTTAVGSSINLAKHECIDFNQVKMNNPIFDPDWDYWKIGIRTDLNQVSTSILKSNSFEGIINEFESSINLSASNYAGYSLFNGTAAAKFADSTHDYPSHTYQYYSTYSYKMKMFSYELTNYKNDLYTYQCHLSDDYYDDAEAFLCGYIDRTTFFDTYGTHIIAKGIFGGEFNINYSVTSSYYDVWSDYYSAISSYLQTSLYSKVHTGSTNSFSVLGNFSFDPELADETINYVTRGGRNSIDISHANLQSAVTQWKSTVSEVPKIIGVTNDGLIPLWDILPLGCDTVANRNYFIEQYQLYASESQTAIRETYEPEIFSYEDGVETGFWPIRVGEVIVSDSGIYNQHYDVVYLNDTYDLKFDYMKENGYSIVEVYVMMEMREIDYGYQIISLYSSEKQNDAYLIHTFEFEYEGTSLGSEYDSSICFARFQIPISTFISSDPEDSYKVVIRYSARGSLEDDWANRNIRVNIVYF